MTRRLAVMVPLFASLALAACGSSPTAGNTDAGLLRDGGSILADAGLPDGGRPDGGRPDGGRADGGRAGDGGLQCLPDGCVDASGTYSGCVNCAGFGRFGPFDVTITQDVCKFRACARQDGGAQNCSDGCIDENGSIAMKLSAMGITADCTGTFDDSTGNTSLNCVALGFAQCSGTLRVQPFTTCQ